MSRKYTVRFTGGTLTIPDILDVKESPTGIKIFEVNYADGIDDALAALHGSR